MVPHDLDHRLDGVGGLQGVQQAAADAEPVHRERLREALAERRGGTGALMGEPSGDGLERCRGLNRVRLRPGGPQPTQDQRALHVGQMVGDVPLLVPTATLYLCARAEDRADGGAEGLAAIDDEEDAPDASRP